MKKLVINHCYGGFGLSDYAVKALGLRSAYADIARDDERLIALVEADADKASGDCAKLRIVELPDGYTDYEVDEYDGFESVIYVLNGKIHHA